MTGGHHHDFDAAGADGTGPARRVFLGWDAPFLPRVADWLHETYSRGTGPRDGTWDMARTMVVLPGSRAMRSLQAILAERAERDRLPLDPPLVVTPARMAQRLLPPARPAPNDAVRRLAWIQALRSTPLGERRSLLGNARDAEDLQACSAVAALLDRAHRVVARAGHDVRAVADALRDGAFDAPIEEESRWRDAARLETRCRATLDRWGFDCDRAALLEAAAGRGRAGQGGSPTDFDAIVLAGVPELGGALAQLLKSWRGTLTALVMAPEPLADSFDALGCVRAEAWVHRIVDIDEARIRVVDGPQQQVETGLAAIAEHAEEGARTDDVVIGLPDESLRGELERRAAEHGCSLHAPTGRPFPRSRPARVLAAIASYLETRSFEAFAELVRAPDVEAHLVAPRGEAATTADGVPPPMEAATAPADPDPATDPDSEPDQESWLGPLDRYRTARVPRTISSRWHDKDAAEALEPVRAALEELLASLAEAPARRPIPSWMEPLASVLATLYGDRERDLDDERDAAVVAACDLVGSALESIAALPTSDAPGATATEAIRFVLETLEQERTPHDASIDSIELLGWLELALDTTPHLVVLGMNEGSVPASAATDPLLPERLRGSLGIPGDASEIARDAYLLSAMTHARRTVTLVVGRFTRDGDPILPSRLLFRADPRTIARRVRHYAKPVAVSLLEPRVRGSGNDDDAARAFPVRPVLVEPRRSDWMSVTAFGAYLRSPYQFYLERALRLRRHTDDAAELDAPTFGILIHEALDRFANHEARDSTDAEEIAAVVTECLGRASSAWFGPAPSAAVALQVQFARLRLERFARWQAGWRRLGWMIDAAEDQYRATFDLVDPPITLVGRIDRIDVNQETGRLAVLDYKTGNETNAESAHRKKRSGEWTNLQLPLYRRLVRANPRYASADIDVGYVLLHSEESKAGASIAAWDERDFASADETARDVIERIRAGQFDEPGRPYPDPVLDALMGKGFLVGAASDLADDNGGAGNGSEGGDA